MAKIKTTQSSILYLPHFWGGVSDIINEGFNKWRFYNGEDLDIFSNRNYIQPSVKFTKDNITGVSKITGFTVGSDSKLYALGQNTTPKAVVYYKDTPTGASPSAWTSLFTSGNAPATQGYSPVTAFTSDESGSKEYLYYHTGSNQLSRYGPLGSSPSETTGFGTLSGLNSTSRLAHLFYSGELFIANGNKIARVTSNGTFVDETFTLPTGLEAVDMTPMVLTTGGDYIAILCKDVNDNNHSIIVVWDQVATTGAIAKIKIPVGHPQWIHKLGNIYLVAGVSNKNNLEIYPVTGVISTDTPLFRIPNVPVDDRPISPVASKSTQGSTFLFGLESTVKSGIYAIGEIVEGLPALVMLHRYDTNDYSKHTPYALLVDSDATYTSYYDGNDSTYNIAIANASNPTYSSKAILETLMVDSGDPFRDKTWDLLQCGIEKLPENCALTITGRNNVNSAYSAINPINTITIPDTEYQEIPIMGFSGRTMQVKVAFTSSNATRPQLKWIGIKFTTNILT